MITLSFTKPTNSKMSNESVENKAANDYVSYTNCEDVTDIVPINTKLATSVGAKQSVDNYIISASKSRSYSQMHNNLLNVNDCALIKNCENVTVTVPINKKTITSVGAKQPVDNNIISPSKSGSYSQMHNNVLNGSDCTSDKQCEDVTVTVPTNKKTTTSVGAKQSADNNIISPSKFGSYSQIHNNIFNGDSIQASGNTPATKQGATSTLVSETISPGSTVNSMTKNSNKPSGDIDFCNVSASSRKLWPVSITSDNAIAGMDNKSGEWVFWKYCDKIVATRTGWPFTIARWIEHNILKSHIHHEALYNFNLKKIEKGKKTKVAVTNNFILFCQSKTKTWQ